jgi:putative ABC transport system ATP-binding protein
MEAIASLRKVSKVFGAGEKAVAALSDIDLEIERGEYLSLVGTSGSGKTTLLNLLGGIERPSAGEIHVDSQRIDALPERRLVELRRRKVAYVFQEARLLASLTALENVMLPAAFSGGSDRKARAAELLARMGLEKRSNHFVHELSGGEAQRVCIARALFNRPALILADEPTGNLDHDTRMEIVKLFEVLNEDGNTVVMVTHDPEVASRARRRLTLQDGRMRENRPLS